MVATGHVESSAAECGGSRFDSGSVALLWSCEQARPLVARAVISSPLGTTLEIAERVLRHFPNPVGNRQALRRDLLRLEDPGKPLFIERPDGHELGLARTLLCADEDPWRANEPGAPIVVGMGGPFYFEFAHTDNARSWARRLQSARPGLAGRWRAYKAERWNSHAMRFRPRPGMDLPMHGFTDLEDQLASVFRQRGQGLVRRWNGCRPLQAAWVCDTQSGSIAV